ncbi:MAG: Ig-like domain-containing protein [Bifidobacteriaceae bacterium]|nr:Ig-like domain-containing protein [Bifidobacteriaceae bacterium]MCI1979484.1 Ig-like domain-containing protein [Bifidobacteriaceae bacterium]
MKNVKKAVCQFGASVVAFATLLACVSMCVPAQPAFAEETEATNVALAKDNDNAPTVTTSYDGATWSPKEGINDGDLKNDAAYGGWGTWGNTSSAEDVTYTWQRAVTTSSSAAWFYTNVPPAVADGDSGIKLPQSASLQYKDAEGAWKEVPNLTVDQKIPSELVDGQAVYGPFTFTFDEVTTTAMKLVLQKQTDDNSGITVTEWQVLGTSAAKPDAPADSGNPDEFLMTQEVYLRTTPGKDPTDKLPKTVWAIPENGPLSYEKVDWEKIPASAYADAATNTEVKGKLEGGAEITATVQVVDQPSEEVVDAEYASTITTPGVKPVLPDTVYLEYADGTKESGAKVEWPEIPAEDYSKAEQDGFVEGTITDPATDVKAEGSFIVVEASAEDANPVISIEFNADALNASGWYTDAPIFTIISERGVSSVPLSKVEYRINGGDWMRYNEPVTLKNQGAVTVEGRVTDEAGHVATQKQTIQVDTAAPTTKATVSGDGKTKVVTVTLDVSDGKNGSGATRTLWSSGPSDSPKSNENTMWGTYDAPFEVSLEKADTPYYVHFYSQDAAGHQEAYETVKLLWDGSASTPALSDIQISCDGMKDGKLSLKEGVNAQLSAAAVPAEAKLPAVSWKSSDESIVSVDKSGKLSALKAGKTTITATVADSDIKQTVEVTVTGTDKDTDTDTDGGTDEGTGAVDGSEHQGKPDEGDDSGTATGDKDAAVPDTSDKSDPESVPGKETDATDTDTTDKDTNAAMPNGGEAGDATTGDAKAQDIDGKKQPVTMKSALAKTGVDIAILVGAVTLLFGLGAAGVLIVRRHASK